MGCTVSKEAATDGPSFTALGFTTSSPGTGDAAPVSHPGDVAGCSSPTGPTATPTSNVPQPPTATRASKIAQKWTTLMVAPSRRATQTVRTSDSMTIQQQTHCPVTRLEGDGEEDAGERPPMHRRNCDAHNQRVFAPSVSIRGSDWTTNQQQQCSPALGSGSSVHSGTSSLLTGAALDRRERDPSLYPSHYESWGDRPQDGRDGGSLLTECAQTINLMVREV